MSESNPQTPPLSSDAELAAAFEAKAVSQQVEGNQEQVGQGDTTLNADPSRTETGTPPSRADDDQSRKELLASLTWDEVKDLEHLRPSIKSEVDREAARELQGKTKVIEDRVRQETSLGYWKQHFEAMDEETLAETLRTNADARKLYAQVTSTPTPPVSNPPAGGEQLINYFANVIKTTGDRVSKLPEDIRGPLESKTYAEAHPDMEPSALIAQWQGEIVEAEVKASLAKEAARVSAVDAESRQLEDSARNQSNGKVLLDGTRNPANVLPDYGTRSDILLEDAFTRKALASRS